jgi:hypothetical protein
MAKHIIVLTAKEMTGAQHVSFAKETEGKYLVGYHSGYAKLAYSSKKAFNAAFAIALERNIKPMTEEEFGFACQKQYDKNIAVINKNTLTLEEMKSLVTPENKALFDMQCKDNSSAMSFIFDLIRNSSLNKTGTANCGNAICGMFMKF